MAKVQSMDLSPDGEENEATKCAICLGHHDPSTECVLPKCQHKFHAVCMANWEAKRLSCPMCRQEHSQSLFPCVILCLKHGLVPAVNGVHKCLEEKCMAEQTCTGSCPNRQKRETSVLLNCTVQRIHEKISSFYNSRYGLAHLDKFSQNGICKKCHQSIFCFWNPDSGIMSRCPCCKSRSLPSY